MDVYCTRPECHRPLNSFSDLDDRETLKTVQQKYCTACGMPLILGGRYIPSRLLGRGGFGAAFLARDRYTPSFSTCVVKQFQPTGDLSPQQLQTAHNLFQREAVTLEELGNQNPQIPDLYADFQITTSSMVPGTGKQDKFFYLVQEFIDGKNLEEELADKGKFSEDEVLEVLREILGVLQFIHDRGVIHRDIKPSNIMRDRTGKLYLLDFGAVKQATASATTGRSTGIYSQGFAPPEQMQGGQVFPSTDLYALGVTAIVLLTGKPSEDLFDSFAHRWNWHSHASVSSRTEAVLNRMLLAAPNARFQSAQEAIAALTPRSAIRAKSAPSVPPTAIQSTPVPAPTPAPSTSFSLAKYVIGSGLTGLEGGILGVALWSFFSISGVSVGIWGVVVGGLVFLQYRQILDGKDLAIVSGLSLAVVAIVPIFRAFLSVPQLLLVAALAGLSAIAVATLFRLVYLLISKVL